MRGRQYRDVAFPLRVSVLSLALRLFCFQFITKVWKNRRLANFRARDSKPPLMTKSTLLKVGKGYDSLHQQQIYRGTDGKLKLWYTEIRVQYERRTIYRYLAVGKKIRTNHLFFHWLFLSNICFFRKIKSFQIDFGEKASWTKEGNWGKEKELQTSFYQRLSCSICYAVPEYDCPTLYNPTK